MEIVVLDGYTLNPGDLSWKGIEKLGNCTIYERTPPEKTVERSKNANAVFTNKVVFDKERIEKSFGSEFSKRGLEYVKENGDLIVTLFIVVEEKRGATAHTTGTGGYGGYYGHGPRYGWGGGYSTTTIEEYDFQEGTLVCDVFDKKDEKLIWEGIGTGQINENHKNRDTRIPKTVQAIMSKFPVPPAGQ